MAASVNTETIPSAFNSVPFPLYHPTKIANTLQGSVWRAYTEENGTNSVVIKITNRHQHNNSICIVNDVVYHGISENIMSEQRILKYLTQQSNCSPFITKFISFLETDEDFVLIQEDGGLSLFAFVREAHRYLRSGKIPMDNWHAVVKVILKQMVEAIAYIHSKNVCHNDISLENFLINDVKVDLCGSGKMKFVLDDFQIKLCDFGVAELHQNSACLSSRHCGKRSYKSPEVINLERNYSGKKNDVWCTGVCLFMLSFGCSPWTEARDTDRRFSLIMNGNILNVLKAWNLLMHIDQTRIGLFQSIFQYEEKRIGVAQLKQHPFYN